MTNKQEGGYEFRLVAWLDILGFSDIIKSPESYTKVKSIIEDIQRQCTEGYIKKTDLGENGQQYEVVPRISLFSDTIVISIKLDDGPINFFTLETYSCEASIYLHFIWRAVSELQCKLLFGNDFSEYKLCLRGAISQGLISHNSSSAYGPLVTELHYYEKEIATFPRVILANSMTNKLGNNPHKDIFTSPMFKKDSDGYYYVNFLEYEETRALATIPPNEDAVEDDKKVENRLQAFKSKRELVTKQCTDNAAHFNSTKNFSVGRKWQWLEEYMKSYRSRFFNNTQN